MGVNLIEANTAAAWQKWHAVAFREQSAAFVPFQRLAPGFPPTQNINSAVSPLPAAGQFSGSIAQTAKNVADCALNVERTAVLPVFLPSASAKPPCGMKWRGGGGEDLNSLNLIRPHNIL